MSIDDRMDAFSDEDMGFLASLAESEAYERARRPLRDEELLDTYTFMGDDDGNCYLVHNATAKLLYDAACLLQHTDGWQDFVQIPSGDLMTKGLDQLTGLKLGAGGVEFIQRALPYLNDEGVSHNPRIPDYVQVVGDYTLGERPDLLESMLHTQEVPMGLLPEQEQRAISNHYYGCARDEPEDSGHFWEHLYSHD